MQRIDESFTENNLEAAMQRDSQGRGSRSDVFRAFREADLLIPIPDSPHQRVQGEVVVLRPGDNVALPVMVDNGRRYVPVFSSMTQMYRFVPRGTPYSVIKGSNLAAVWSDEDWMLLNPRGDIGTELSPRDVKSIVAAVQARPIDYSPETTVAVGEPQTTPAGLLDAIAAYARSIPKVRAAYRAILKAPGEVPQLVIGFEADGEDDAVLHGAGEIIARGPYGPVSLGFINRSSSSVLDRYMFAQSRPFFVRP